MFLTTKQIRLLIESVLTEAEIADENISMQLVNKFQKGISALGVNVKALKPLATGTHGTAFAAGDKVLKITNDEKEAKIAAALIDKDLKNVVKFYSVIHFKDTEYYAILQEKLDPMPEAEANKINKLLVMTGLPIWIKRAGGDWAKVKELTKAYALSQIKKKFPENHASPEAKEYAKELIGAWNALVNQYGIRDMFNTLNELGIEFHDYHAGNLMLRGEDIVLIDLGMSKMQGGGGNIKTIDEIKLVEKIATKKGVKNGFNKSGKFNISQFKQIQSAPMALEYAQTYLEPIGAGSSRAAFILTGRYALKVALNDKGLAQNEAEFTAYQKTTEETRKIVAKVYQHGSSFQWLISDLVKPLKTAAEFKSLTGEDFEKLCDNIEELYTNGQPNEDSELLDAVENLINDNELEWADLTDLWQWGKTPDGRAVVLDYGFTTDVYEKHYKSKDPTQSAETNDFASAKTTLDTGAKTAAAPLSGVKTPPMPV
jgi:hypothetical protein